MFMPKEEVEKIRELYPEGTRVELISMGADPQPVPAGTLGVVRRVDDAGTIHVSWHNNSSLGVVPGVDVIKKI